MVAAVIKQAAMVVAGATLGRNRDDSSRVPPYVRSQHSGLDLELANCIRRGNCPIRAVNLGILHHRAVNGYGRSVSLPPCQ